jgi:hypothetical protein
MHVNYLTLLMTEKNKNIFLLLLPICLSIFFFNNIKAQSQQLNQAVDTLLNEEYEIIYDTVFVAGDTIRKTDTIEVVLQNKLNSNISFELSFSPFVSIASYEPKNETYAQYAFKVNQARSALLSYRIDGNVTFHKKNNAFSIGIGISNFREKQEYDLKQWSFFSSQYTKLDTIDSYFVVKGNDTSLIAVTKENLYFKTDSLLELKKNELLNNLIYFEIPLIYGYQIVLNHFSIELKTGINTAFLIYKSVKTLTLDGLSVRDISNEEVFNNINISLYLGATIEYPLNDRLNLVVEPWFLNNFSSIYKTNYIYSQQLQSYGLKVGLSIKL